MTIIDAIEKFKTASRKLILLDYDGTLVELTDVPMQATPTQRLNVVLNKLHTMPDTDLVVITGRARGEIDALIGHFPFTIVAEHGAMIRQHATWKETVEPDGEWKNDVLSMINPLAQKYPDSSVEEKKYAIAWHYRRMDPEKGALLSRELIRILLLRYKDKGLKILDGNKVVEVTAGGAGKGKAVLDLLVKDSYDYILAMGDDTTDEDMFSVLAGTSACFTIKIGKGNTKAALRLSNVEQALSLLEQL